METTRQTILGILRRRKATVGDLTETLALAPATIRRHLDILARDGHVDVSQVRRKTGRPHYLFSLSESGESLFPKHYGRITNRLIKEIVALTPEEMAGRGGKEVADLVFNKMAVHLAQLVAPRIHGATLSERIERTTHALAEEGIVFDVEEADGDCVLVGHGCPCPRVADTGGQVCVHDQRLLSLLLAADVTYVEPGSVGQTGYCAYRVQERKETPAGADSRSESLPAQTGSV